MKRLFPRKRDREARRVDGQRVFTRRAMVLGGAQALLCSALVGRMYYLQVVEGERYALLADENRINMRLLAPPRGAIIDRWGRPIAGNDLNYRVMVVAEQTPSLEATLHALARILPLDEAEIERVLRDIRRQRSFVPVSVADNLTWDQVAQIELNAPDLPGVAIEAEWRRIYPYGGATGHALGYVSAVTEAEQEADPSGDPLLRLPGFRIGKSGIEKTYDRQLRGAGGTSYVEVNAVGRVIRELSRVEGQAGQTLTTTIDMGLQLYAQQRLAAELAGAAVVLDALTGEVLALASTPTYDPGQFSRGIGASEWRSLIADELHPLTNKAIAGQYAPGSTFKMMVALAALEEGVKPETRVSCGGSISLGRARFHCWKRGGHGPMTMLTGLRSSCDVFFYETARKVGIDKIAAMCRRFGLGAPTGIDMSGEKPGLIPDTAWKRQALNDKWHPGETLVAGIGQGFITTTPLQLAVMTARIANGGFAVTPRLLRGLAPAAEVAATAVPFNPPVPAAPAAPAPMGLDPAHLAVVAEGMNMVCNDPRGTGYRVRIEDPAMAMAGKTGTSQVRRITAAERRAGVKKNEDKPYKERDHALFVGFAPVAAPRYVAAVIVEHGGGGSAIAGPIARDILIEAQTRNPLAAPATVTQVAALRP